MDITEKLKKLENHKNLLKDKFNLNLKRNEILNNLPIEKVSRTEEDLLKELKNDGFIVHINGLYKHKTKKSFLPNYAVFNLLDDLEQFDLKTIDRLNIASVDSIEEMILKIIQLEWDKFSQIIDSELFKEENLNLSIDDIVSIKKDVELGLPIIYFRFECPNLKNCSNIAKKKDLGICLRQYHWFLILSDIFQEIEVYFGKLKLMVAPIGSIDENSNNCGLKITYEEVK